MTFISPTVGSKRFTCPHCGAIAHQSWWSVSWAGKQPYPYSFKIDDPIKVAECSCCRKHSLWLKGKILYPDETSAPLPSQDMPEEVKKLYLEASSIANKSPRAATALLRLAIQILCKELGGKGKNINEDIKMLVKQGLPARIQRCLDIVRVTGNNSVHPGQIDVDNLEVAMALFDQINIIIDYMLTMPNKIDSAYNSLPEDALEAIEKRDSIT